MSRTTLRRRSKLLAATLSLALVGSLFGTGTANAFDPTTGPNAKPPGDTDPVMLASSKPEVFRTENGNAAGDLSITDPDTASGDLMVVEQGDQFVIEVSDNFALNCTGATSTERIGFSSVPDVNVTSGNSVVEVSAEIRSSDASTVLRGAAPFCQGFVPTTKDQLVITVDQAPTNGAKVASIDISGIKYDVGGLADVGDVSLLAEVNDTGGSQAITTGTPAANAYVSNLEVTVGAGIAIQPGANRPAPNITFRETEPDATTPAGNTGGVCVVLQDGNVSFVGTPTVATTAPAAGADVASAPTVLDGGNVLRFMVTDGPGAESTFVLSNIHVNTQAGNFGAEHIQVFQCDPTAAAFVGTGSDSDPQFDAPIVPGTQEPLTPAPDAADVTAYTTNQRVFVTVVRALRFAGLDRFETAQAIGDRTFDCSDFAIIARGDLFPDALAGNYVAGQVYAPILLVQTNAIPNATLEALKSMGVTDVIIMGGTSAVSAAVASQLDSTTSYECHGGPARRTPEDAIVTLNESRLGGADRFGTARLAALFGGADKVGRLDSPDGTDNDLRTAILANGLNFPDALAAGPMAFQGFACSFPIFGGDCNGFPLVLANGTGSTIPSSTQSALDEQAIQQVIIVGGTAAVPQAIEDALVAQGLRVIRLGGANRNDTATKIADFEYDSLSFDCTTVNPPSGTDPDLGSGFFNACDNPIVSLARGDDFADALTMGPHAGVYSHPILLTASPSDLSAETAAYLASIGADLGVFRIDVAGGTAAISNAVVTSALSALGGL